MWPFNNRSKPKQPSEERGTFGGLGGFFRGNRRSKPPTSNLGQTTPLVIGVFNGISDSIAQCPVSVYRDVDNTPVKLKTPKWLERPNLLQTPYEFWESVVQSMLYYGNAYIYKLKTLNGRLLELHVIHPDDVTVDQQQRFGPKTFNVLGLGETLTDADILHIKAYPDPEGLYGYSPIQRAKLFVDSAYAAQKYSASLYENNLNISMVIETPDMKTEDEAKRMGKVFSETHRADAEGGSVVGVLTGGAKAKPLNLTPEQAQFIESERWNAQKFATLLNIPPFMVDAGAGSWAGTGLQVQNAVYEQRTLQPWMKRIEDAINTYLLPSNQSMKFQIDVVLRSSPAEQADIHYKQVGVPWKTVNEARKEIGLGPVPGGEELATQSWFAKQSDAMKQADLNQEKTQKEIDQLKKSPGGGNKQ